MTLHVYQIGVGDFGRYGFEKLIEIHRNFDRVDVKLEAFCDRDFDNAEKARKFAERNGIDVEEFTDVKEMYEKASGHEGKVMIYDAGPTEDHADNVYRSLRHGFFHLAEKPPSMTRKEHIKEKKLAEKENVMWKADFIERESPVVKKALELLEGKNIDRIEVFRESSVGIEKMLDPVARAGVKGGDILDKMSHEVYVLDMLEASGIEEKPEIQDAESKYFLPKKPGSEKLMAIHGGYTEEINEETATAMTSAAFNAEGADIRFNSSWLGPGRESRINAQKVRKITGHNLINKRFRELQEKAYPDEESRYFIVRGDRDLAGDMLNKKLFDLDTGEEVDLDYYLHDQLYRVIEKAVLQAADKESYSVNDKETDIFMNMLFDVRDKAVKGDFLEERRKSLEKVDNMIVEDRKVLETEEHESLAG